MNTPLLAKAASYLLLAACAICFGLFFYSANLANRTSARRPRVWCALFLTATFLLGYLGFKLWVVANQP